MSLRSFQARLSLSTVLLSLAAYVALSDVALAYQLPDLGESSENLVSVREQEQIGREFMRNARKNLPYIDDPEISDYLNTLGNSLLRHSGSDFDRFQFYLIDDNRLNAFAVPGGHISVHTGLILASDNENELAGVLAHEIAHINQRHLPRMLARSKQQTLPATLAILAGVLLGGQAGTAAIAATNAALIEDQLKYNRDFESEADTLGIQTLVNARFDPEGLLSFFEKLYNRSRIQESRAPEFLRTHPLTTSRITEIRSRIDSFPEVRRNSSSRYTHVRTKIQAVYASSPVDAVAFFKNTESAGIPEQRYGLGLALARGKNFSEAVRILDDLHRNHPQNTFYGTALAYAKASAGEFNQAADVMAAVYEKFSNDPVVGELYARALVQSRQYAKATSLLRTLVTIQPTRSVLFGLLAKSLGETGKLHEAHFYLAESMILEHDYKTAINHLYAARRATQNDFYMQSRIDARLRETQELLNAEAIPKN